ncbi:MAG: DNA methylase [Candidatus Thorarchaeota archaeon]|nr:MAG: DNA methylase [Candidatus Thorarchaeota archaeon]
MEDKRFIEISFPIKDVSQESAKEKNIRHGHISTLHIWWARRPLASSRATAYASLIPVPRDNSEWDKKRRFIIELSKWGNSLNPYIIDKARKDILEANGGKPPRVLDPFAGGGAIPLEALRLGCETHAGEYNPVAVLILKCTLEYPQKYGKQKNEGWFKTNINPLLRDVKKWGNWVLEQTKKEIGRFYPQTEGFIPVGYIWARTIPCQNPSCQAEIPLMRQFWLAKKDKKKVALKPFVKDDGRVEFKIVGQDEPFPKNFDPSKGTVKGAIATCPVCGSTVDDKTVRSLFQKGKAGQKLIAVVLHHANRKGKTYRIATEEDFAIYKKAEEYLQEKRKKLMDEWGIDPVPDEPTPEGKGKGAERAFSVRNYGPNKWGDLFNSRQKLALITFVENVRAAHKKMLEEGYEEEYAKAVVSYLALVLDKILSKCNVIARWNNIPEKIEYIFSRQALPMLWDYAESNPFSQSAGSWQEYLDYTLNAIKHCSHVFANFQPSILKVSQFSATSLPYRSNYFDAVFTDPPYYDNVPYSYLSDFFYVWLKRMVGDLYPELFSTPLTPKSKEIVAYTHNKTWEEAKQQFEEMLKQSFKEIHRVLKPHGIVTIVYTHKSTSGWESLINSLLDSGLVVTASWPIHTEMKARLRAKESAALASSIYFVARKLERKETGWFNEVKEEIKSHVYKRLDRLWQEGISGADYFIAAIGSAVEIFGRYKKVMDYEGKPVGADTLLNFVRSVVREYVAEQKGVAGLSPLTNYYFFWRWTYGEAKVHFDEARKLAVSVGINLANEWNKGFIRKEKEFIKILGPHERNLDEILESDELIDVLHATLILWKEGNKEKMKKILTGSGWGRKDIFYRVAQAISGTLPLESKEKKLLDGFLSNKEKIISEIKNMVTLKDAMIQGRLFE